jgi:hypothetical protein
MHPFRRQVDDVPSQQPVNLFGPQPGDDDDENTVMEGAHETTLPGEEEQERLQVYQDAVRHAQNKSDHPSDYDLYG